MRRFLRLVKAVLWGSQVPSLFRGLLGNSAKLGDRHDQESTGQIASRRHLDRDLEIAYSSAWHLAYRFRTAFGGGGSALFAGPGEADETYFGGKRKNMVALKRKEMTGRGTVGKTAVAGIRDRDTGRVVAQKLSQTDTAALQGVVRDHLAPGAKLYTDEAAVYSGMPEFKHEAVNHSVGEYVRGMAHTNGIESFLVHVEARLSRHLPPLLRQAYGLLHRGVLRAL